MSKVPVSEAAEILGVTKEAVYNRIRRGTLKTFEKDGVKYVVLDGYEPQAAPKLAPKTSKSAKSSESKKAAKAGEFDVNEFLLSQIGELKEQNQNLQADKDRLFKEKEQMLIERKNEILQIYKDRDEKLMQFLNAMQRPLLAPKNESAASEVAIDAQIEDESKWINLSEYLKELNLKPKATKKISEKIIKAIHHSKFIKFKRGVILVRRHKNLKELIGEI